LYALDDHVWGLKITALEEYANFATLDTKILFSKLKSHELSHKGHPNHDASLTSKALITSARVGGHDANPTNAVWSALEFALSSLVAAFDEQYDSIPNDEIALLARNFCALHKFCKERRSPRGCFECSDTTHFIADYPKRKKFNSTNKYDYTNRNDSSNKGDNNKKDRFEDKKKKFQKIMSWLYTALSDFDFSSEDFSSLEDDEKIDGMKCNFIGLWLMGKSSRNTANSDSDVSDDLFFESFHGSCWVFCENKNLNLKLENSSAEIASLQLMHDEMSVKPCYNCKMIMANYIDLWIMHTQVASQLQGAKSELRELKACSLLLGTCTSCPMLRSHLEACAIEIKELKHQIDHSSRYSVLSPLCEMCGSLKVKLFYATKENTELK
jgi:hypothetical protein